METEAVIGVFCVSPQACLEDVAGQPLVRLTMKRVQRSYLHVKALVPWRREMDHLAEELKSWRYSVVRCHPDHRIAMRDMVAYHEADMGVLVLGTCAVIDASEISLAIARVKHGIGEDGRYASDRVRCYKSAEWLKVSDTDEWPTATATAAEARKFYGTHDTEKASAREVWAELRGQ